MKKHNEIPEKPIFDERGYQVNMHDLNGEPLPDLAKLKIRGFLHGGRRSGSGRKKTGRKQLLLRLMPETIASLRAQAKAQHKTLSEIAEQRLAVS